jgi:hypothetical protein
LYSRETLNDLLGLAEIRNIFAHGLPASFDSKEVRLLLNQIELEGRLRKVRALKPVCSGQVIPDTALSFSSATAGANPLLN